MPEDLPGSEDPGTALDNRTDVRYYYDMTTTQITSNTPEVLAAAAGMTPTEYKTWIRSLRAKSTDEKFGRIAEIVVSDTEFNESNIKTTSRPNPDAPTKTPEERYAEVCEWLLSLDRKAEVRDITHMNKSVAAWWLRRYEGSFEFLNDLKAKGGVKSDGQAKGVLNCIRADLLRAARPAPTPAPERAARPETAALDISTLPAGRYAYQPVDGAQAQFLVVQRPDEGQWAGCTFVKAQHSDDLERAGFQGSNSTSYRGTHVAALTEILADPREAMELYGRLLEHCGHCGRTLTNEESRERGIGPVCARAMGW